MKELRIKKSSFEPGGEDGIRTHEALLTLTRFPGVRLRPLGHLSNFAVVSSSEKINGFSHTLCSTVWLSGNMIEAENASPTYFHIAAWGWCAAKIVKRSNTTKFLSACSFSISFLW